MDLVFLLFQDLFKAVAHLLAESAQIILLIGNGLIKVPCFFRIVDSLVEATPVGEVVLLHFLGPVDSLGRVGGPYLVERVLAVVLGECNVATSKTLMELIVRLSRVKSFLVLVPSDESLWTDWK